MRISDWSSDVCSSDLEALRDRIAEATGTAGEPVALGSSLKFCRLAEGGMDVYPRFGPTSEWDTAAGQAIVEAAGGVVLDPRGRPLRYNQRDTVLNGDFMVLGDPALPWKEWVGDRAGCVLRPASAVPIRPVRSKMTSFPLKRETST